MAVFSHIGPVRSCKLIHEVSTENGVWCWNAFKGSLLYICIFDLLYIFSSFFCYGQCCVFFLFYCVYLCVFVCLFG